MRIRCRPGSGRRTVRSTASGRATKAISRSAPRRSPSPSSSGSCIPPGREISLSTREAWRLVRTEFFSRERILLGAADPRDLAGAGARLLAGQGVDPGDPSVLRRLLFHQLDRTLHFGDHPWTLLQPILGYPVVTWGIDFLDALWLFVMYFAILLQITSTRDRAACARSS